MSSNASAILINARAVLVLLNGKCLICCTNEVWCHTLGSPTTGKLERGNDVGVQHTRAGRFRAKVGGIVGAGLIAGWFLSPFLRLIHPWLLFSVALAMVCMCLMVWDDGTGNEEGRTSAKDRRFIIFVTGGLLLATASYAVVTATKLDEKCQAVQKQMLGERVEPSRSHQKTSDPADVFQALGCRPQFLLPL